MTHHPHTTSPSMQAGSGLRDSFSPRARMRPRRGWPLSAAAALLLAACGGGGDAVDIANTEYAVQAAMGHLLREAGSWTMTGVGPDGQPFTMIMDFAPLSVATVPIVGGEATRSAETLTLQIDGQTSGSGGPTFFFNPADLSFVASDNGTDTCSVVRSNTVLPALAKVGTSGDMFAEADFDGCAGDSSIVGDTLSQWSLETSKGIVLLCWTLTTQDLAGATQATQSTCVQIAADGTLGSKARFTLSALGFSLAASNL